MTCNDGHTETYAYNALGALSTHAGVAVDHQRPRLSGGGSASAGLPATHGGQPVTVDAVGKVTALQGTTLEWNRLGRLTKTIQGGVTTEYGHDAHFRRVIQQRTGSPLELYLYEGANIAAVASGDGVAGVQRRYLFDGVDHPVWMWDRVADAGVYFEIDCIGNVRRLRGGARYGAGAALPSDLGGYKYSAFGRTLAADAGTPPPVVDGGGFGQALRWQGRWLDTATGLYDVRNRQWSPELGAFLSPDEFEYFGTNNTLWSWPGQNPVRHRDPSGNDTFGRAVAGGLGAFLGAQVGFSLGGGSGLVVGAAEGGVPAVATAPAGALVGAGEGFLLGGALGIAIYDFSQTAGASIWDVLDSPLLAQRGKGNVGDTGIEEEARRLLQEGAALDICQALAGMMDDAASIADPYEREKRKQKIKATQKKHKCRPSRQSKE